jgi:hypothetical protein
MIFQKEFLQLQEGQIADVTFLFPTGLKREGNFGPYFLYTVKHEGKEKFLKVTERLEKELRKMNVKTKQVYSLFKETVHPPKGEPFTVIRIVERNIPQPAPEPTAHAPLAQNATQQQEPTSQQVASKIQDVVFTGDKQVMLQSILDAVDITKVIGGIDWRNTDIEKIGVSLFLSRTGQLTTEQVLSNGNGRKPRKTKIMEKPKPELVPSNGNGKVHDVPF